MKTLARTLLLLTLALVSGPALAKKGDSSVSLLLGEAYSPTAVRISLGTKRTYDFGIEGAGGPLFFGSRGWKDNLYIGAGLLFPSSIGIYSNVGIEGEFLLLTWMAECLASMTSEPGVSAYLRVGVGYSW